MEEFGQLVGKLCAESRKQYVNPYDYLEWPEKLDPEQWTTSPELISLYGTEPYEKLSEPQRKKLSFHEAVNFFSLNIHGEKSLVEGLAQRVYRKSNDVITPYLHHFLDEENKHMVYFGGFCMRYGGKVYPDRKMSVPREFAPGEEDFLFFAKVMVFEEIVDLYNVRMSTDERLAPIARQINLIHHREEMRHLVFGREMVKRLFDHYGPKWTPETLRGVREYLIGYITATWKEYYNPDVYKDAGFCAEARGGASTGAGLEDPYGLAQRAFGDERCRKHRREVSGKFLRHLVQQGILEKEPEL